jgi:hypothetical protein
MEDEFEVIGNIEAVAIHGNDELHEIIEKAEEGRPLEGVAEGDIVLVRFEQVQAVMEEREEGLRGGQNDHGLLIHLLTFLPLILQKSPHAEDLAVGIRAFIEMDHWFSRDVFPFRRDPQFREIQSKTLLKEKEGFVSAPE